MKTMTFREAVRAALRRALTSDPRVLLMGEDVGRYGGAFAVSLGLLEEFVNRGLKRPGRNLRLKLDIRRSLAIRPDREVRILPAPNGRGRFCA